MFSFPLSHLLSDVFTVRFIVEMSDAESVVEESTPKDPSANSKPQSSELVDKVFSLFKGYLNTQLEAQGKLIRLIEGHSKIQRSASEFRFKGNGKQFEVNAKLESLLSRIKASADDPSQVNTFVQEAQLIIRKRQKSYQILSIVENILVLILNIVRLSVIFDNICMERKWIREGLFNVEKRV